MADIISINKPINSINANQPLDIRTLVNSYSDISLIPNPYIGMTITVKVDETNDNKMTDYKVKSLKSNELGMNNTVIDEIERLDVYIGMNEIKSQLEHIDMFKGEFINVSSFFTLGEVDDTISIKKALESEYNLNFDKKIFKISERLDYDISNRILKGSGVICYIGGLSENELSQEAIITFRGANIVVSDLLIDVGGEWRLRPFTWQDGYDDYIALRKRNYSAINFEDCNNLIVSNLSLKNGRNGLLLKNVVNFTISNIKIYKMMADGIFITDGCSFGIVKDCYAEECNDDVYACDGYSLDASIQPHNVIFDNCNSHNCVGALVCLEGSYNTKFLNSTGTEIKHKPFKTGLMQPYSNNPVLAYGSYQTIENCKFSLADTLQGDSNGELESVICGVNSGDNIILRNIDIIKPESSKQFEIQLNGTNYKIDNVKVRNVGFCLRRVKNCNIINSDFELNDAFFIIEGTSINIEKCKIHNKNLSNIRGVSPIIYSGQNNCSLYNSDLTSEGDNEYQIELLGNAPTYTRFKTDIQNISCSASFEGLAIKGVYLAGKIADARFADGQLVYDQYGFGLIKNKSRIKLALLSDTQTV